MSTAENYRELQATINTREFWSEYHGMAGRRYDTDTVKCVLVTSCLDKFEEDLREKGYESEDNTLDELFEKMQEKIATTSINDTSFLGSMEPCGDNITRERCVPGGTTDWNFVGKGHVYIDLLGKGTPKCKWKRHMR